jgi:hypothetical protein
LKAKNKVVGGVHLEVLVKIKLSAKTGRKLAFILESQDIFKFDFAKNLNKREDFLSSASHTLPFIHACIKIRASPFFHFVATSLFSCS